MDENSIKIINTSYHKKMTDNHLAQVNFTAIMPRKMWGMYNTYTSSRRQDGSYPVTMGRIRFLEVMHIFNGDELVTPDNDTVTVFGRVSHGYGYDISQDIFNSIMFSKVVK